MTISLVTLESIPHQVWNLLCKYRVLLNLYHMSDSYFIKVFYMESRSFFFSPNKLQSLINCKRLSAAKTLPSFYTRSFYGTQNFLNTSDVDFMTEIPVAYNAFTLLLFKKRFK